MVRYLSDECFSGAIVIALKAAGVDVVRAVDICPASTDEMLLARAFEDGRLLLTEDHGFGELCVRLQLPAHGVVVASVKALTSEKQAARVIEALAKLGDRVRGSFVTIEPTRTRIRALNRS